jgi:hypothetical protein
LFTPGRRTVGSSADHFHITPATDLWVQGWVALNTKKSISDLKGKILNWNVGIPQFWATGMGSAKRRQENDLNLNQIKGSDPSPPRGFYDGDLRDFSMRAEIDMDPCF